MPYHSFSQFLIYRQVLTFGDANGSISCKQSYESISRHNQIISLTKANINSNDDENTLVLMHQYQVANMFCPLQLGLLVFIKTLYYNFLPQWNYLSKSLSCRIVIMQHLG